MVLSNLLRYSFRGHLYGDFIQKADMIFPGTRLWIAQTFFSNNLLILRMLLSVLHRITFAMHKKHFRHDRDDFRKTVVRRILD